VSTSARTTPWPAAALEAVAGVLGDTDAGLTGSQIGRLLAQVGLPDPGPITKKQRLVQAFDAAQRQRKSSVGTIDFIEAAMAPASYVNSGRVFSQRQGALNECLAFVGLRLQDDGHVREAPTARTLDEASRHANALRRELERRNAQPHALKWCSEEILKKDPFHASEEAVKGLMQRIRDLSDCEGDTARLIDRALSIGSAGPVLAINTLATDSERDEQSGFVNLLKGLCGMYRNPIAHDPRALRHVSDSELLELLTTVSMAHRRLDGATRMRNP
jgi:uncharacterized protein (TIGR02391 family)